jgi:hypothetical protein
MIEEATEVAIVQHYYTLKLHEHTFVSHLEHSNTFHAIRIPIPLMTMIKAMAT